MVTDITKKNTTLELTVSPDYVETWGVWEAVRELIQNALDSRDRGNALSITRGVGEKKTIRITNTGTHLSRQTLLLGATDKRGDSSQRGHFGEGYKLAFLVLCRKGVDVQVRTGSEMWTPFIEKSTTFGGNLLKVKVRQQPKFESKVEIQLHGLSDTDWETIQGLLIDIEGMPKTRTKKGEAIRVGSDAILTGDRFRGLLFSRGLFVSRLPDNFAFGYDLSDVTLDRDRKQAETWSLRSNIKHVLSRALESGTVDRKRLYALLGEDSGEESILGAYYEYEVGPDSLAEELAAEFLEAHGEDAIPVSSTSESMEAEHHGLKGVVVSRALRNIVSLSTGKLAERKTQRALDTKTSYSAGDLDAAEKETLSWAMDLIAQAEPMFDRDKVSVVDFYGETINGTCSSAGDIRLARRRLTNRADTVSTLVHEAAHLGGAQDGSHEHMHAIQGLFARIVVIQADAIQSM